MLHLIPDDGAPHAPTTECGCGPQLVTVAGGDGSPRPAIQHQEAGGDNPDAERAEPS